MTDHRVIVDGFPVAPATEEEIAERREYDGQIVFKGETYFVSPGQRVVIEYLGGGGWGGGGGGGPLCPGKGGAFGRSYNPGSHVTLGGSGGGGATGGGGCGAAAEIGRATTREEGDL